MDDRSAPAPALGPSRDELEPVLRQVFEEARAYLASIDGRVVREPVVRELTRGIAP